MRGINPLPSHRFSFEGEGSLAAEFLSVRENVILCLLLKKCRGPERVSASGPLVGIPLRASVSPVVQIRCTFWCLFIATEDTEFTESDFANRL